jgi:hypothetical protein
MNGLAGAGVALKQFMDSINGGKYPGAEAIDKAVDAIVFFAVEGDKAYAREYLAHCSMNEFVQVLRIIETCVNDYAATVRAMQMHAASGRGVINGD